MKDPNCSPVNWAIMLSLCSLLKIYCCDMSFSFNCWLKLHLTVSDINLNFVFNFFFLTSVHNILHHFTRFIFTITFLFFTCIFFSNLFLFLLVTFLEANFLCFWSCQHIRFHFWLICDRYSTFLNIMFPRLSNILSSLKL